MIVQDSSNLHTQSFNQIMLFHEEIRLQKILGPYLSKKPHVSVKMVLNDGFLCDTTLCNKCWDLLHAPALTY